MIVMMSCISRSGRATDAKGAPYSHACAVVGLWTSSRHLRCGPSPQHLPSSVVLCGKYLSTIFVIRTWPWSIHDQKYFHHLVDWECGRVDVGHLAHIVPRLLAILHLIVESHIFFPTYPIQIVIIRAEWNNQPWYSQRNSRKWARTFLCYFALQLKEKF